MLFGARGSSRGLATCSRNLPRPSHAAGGVPRAAAGGGGGERDAAATLAAPVVATIATLVHTALLLYHAHRGTTPASFTRPVIAFLRLLLRCRAGCPLAAAASRLPAPAACTAGGGSGCMYLGHTPASA